ncbi:MAG TPA: hypothetical protein VIJ35_19190 [Bradyrhizobium sp.]
MTDKPTLPARRKPIDALTAAPTPHIPDKHHQAIRNNVRGKLREALLLMVFGPDRGDKAGEAMDFADAARSVNFNPRAMRKALEKPHVRAFLRAQKEVFRAAISAKTFSRLDRIAETSGNDVAKVNALKMIETSPDVPLGGEMPLRAGLIFIVQQLNGAAPVVIAPPVRVIEHESGAVVPRADELDDEPENGGR